MKTSLSVIALAVAFAAPAYAEDAKTIAQRENQKWLHAYNAGDATALTALYTKDAILMPQGVAEPLMGEPSIHKYLEGEMKHRLLNMALPVTEAKMVGPNTLFEAGIWSGDIPGANGGAPTHISGTYLTVLEHQGSEWRLQADTWNMMPPAQ